MKILFLTIGSFGDVRENGVYTDLLREIKNKGNEVYVVCARERRHKKPTTLKNEHGINVLRVKTGNITKVNFIEKGFSTLTIGHRYKKAVKDFFSEIKFDVVLYSTPPITVDGLVKFIKNRDKAFTYLMLKDIFPQNTVDLGILNKSGVNGLIYKYFRNKENKLYKYSDKIGCMSPANMEFLKKNNPEIPQYKIEICPNTIDVIEKPVIERNKICEKYGIPNDKLLLTYGGNFGKPQNIDFIIDVIKNAGKIPEIHFIMCGGGTDFYKIKDLNKNGDIDNLTVIDTLKYREYLELLSLTDIGLLFLDNRFTIPNFPSRILDYMNCELPVIAATDINSDIGKMIVENDFGWWCQSNNAQAYVKLLEEILKSINDNTDYLRPKANNSKACLNDNFRTEIAYNIIIDSYKNK